MLILDWRERSRSFTTLRMTKLLSSIWNFGALVEEYLPDGFSAFPD
jgi:hypothetical protein